MSEFVLGEDTHRYNGEMDYFKSSLAGIEFVLSRCGGAYIDTGQPFADYQWVKNVSNAPDIIPCFGAWWYFVGCPSTINSQADYCASLVSPYKEKLTLGFWLDCEKWLAGYTAENNRDMVLAFISRFEMRAGTPVRGIYTRQTIWDSFVAPHPKWASLDLWGARFNSTLAGPWSDGRYAFRDWKEWKVWQYSADGNGLAQTYGAPPDADPDIDLDRWCGTLDELYVYAGIQKPPVKVVDMVHILWDKHPEFHP